MVAVIEGHDMTETHALVKLDRASLLIAGFKSHHSVAGSAREIKKHLDDAITDALSVIFRQQPHPFEFAHCVVDLPHRAGADQSTIVEHGEKNPAPIKIVRLDIDHIVEHVFVLESLERLIDGAIGWVDRLSDSDNDALGFRNLARFNRLISIMLIFSGSDNNATTAAWQRSATVAIVNRRQRFCPGSDAISGV